MRPLTLFSITLSALPVFTVNAKTFVVNVTATEDIVFSLSEVSASISDVIVFQLLSGGNFLFQSTHHCPCTPRLKNPWRSNFQLSDQTHFLQSQFVVSQVAEPCIFYYDHPENPCRSSHVFIVNPKPVLSFNQSLVMNKTKTCGCHYISACTNSSTVTRTPSSGNFSSPSTSQIILSSSLETSSAVPSNSKHIIPVPFNLSSRISSSPSSNSIITVLSTSSTSSSTSDSSSSPTTSASVTTSSADVQPSPTPSSLSAERSARQKEIISGSVVGIVIIFSIFILLWFVWQRARRLRQLRSTVQTAEESRLIFTPSRLSIADTTNVLNPVLARGSEYLTVERNAETSNTSMTLEASAPSSPLATEARSTVSTVVDQQSGIGLPLAQLGTESSLNSFDDLLSQVMRHRLYSEIGSTSMRRNSTNTHIRATSSSVHSTRSGSTAPPSYNVSDNRYHRNTGPPPMPYARR